jgi:glycosyltransferase involved in cell wall biosynthesis
MTLISVIVPVFNAQDHLDRCLNSIISQSYKNLEIILINDGSTDESGKICEDYKNKDKRIKVIHTKNRGQSSARNIGIDSSSGEYLAFVDSDDWIVSDIYEYCLKLAEKYNSEIVDFKVKFTNGENFSINNYPYEIKKLSGKEILRHYLYMGQVDKAPFSPCRKLFKSCLFNNIRFPEGKINEDITTNYKVLLKCNKMISSDKIGYFYFQNNNSTTRNGFKMRDFHLLDACEELVSLTREESYMDIKYLAKVKYARSYFSLLSKIAYYGFEESEIEKRKIIIELTKNLRKEYFLLITSPMSINRKLMLTALSININLLSVPLSIYKKTIKKNL